MPKGKTKRKVKSRTIVNFCLDESGSMLTVWDETISSFNSYIEKLKSEKGDVLLTLVKFNTTCSTVVANAQIKEVGGLTTKTYQPDGFTALYDAIGHCVKMTERELKKDDKALVIILTDGHENSSREWSHEKIRALIESRQKDGWTFVYLGCTADAWDISASLGVSVGNTIHYDANNIGGTMSALACSTTRYFRSARAGLSTTDFASRNAADYAKAGGTVAGKGDQSGTGN